MKKFYILIWIIIFISQVSASLFEVPPTNKR